MNQLVVLSVDTTELAELPVLVSDVERPVVVRVTGADAVVALAAFGPDWEGSWGVWLTASAGYPASMIARDVKTLSHLMALDHVVVDAASDAASHADVVAALLTEHEVNLRNDVATIVHAFNRPAPPQPVTVWHVDGDALRQGEHTLRLDETVEAVAIYRA